MKGFITKAILTFFILHLSLSLDDDRLHLLERMLHDGRFFSRLDFHLSKITEGGQSPSELSLDQKRGLGKCINKCLQGVAKMNFIQCKSMCHRTYHILDCFFMLPMGVAPVKVLNEVYENTWRCACWF